MPSEVSGNLMSLISRLFPTSSTSPPAVNLLMPKKRFAPQYSKPQSTVHPSLQSPATASSASSTNNNDAAPTVNDLISSLRKTSSISQASISAPSIATGKTLPPQIRQLLSQPETPTPKPRTRDRRRFDANGHRIPAGPAPPSSWIQSRHTPSSLVSRRGEGKVFPSDVDHLPGLAQDGERLGKGRRLQDMCLRTMAREWDYVKEYERNNLADLPVGVRMLLLSYIAVYGPQEGVGFEALRNLLIHPASESEAGDEEEQRVGAEHNEGFFRLDVSGAIGRSINFKQLTDLVQKPTPPSEDQFDFDLSWEESLTRNLTPPIPHLTHLSLSHPPNTISWPRLLAFTRHIPTLTHLSLAFWPVPSLTPNAKTAVVTSRFGKEVQYGGTGFYSHSLDNDFREASDVLRRLAGRLYGLEELDLSGCGEWLRALRWMGDVGEGAGLDWGSQWIKLRTLKLFSGVKLEEESEYSDVVAFVQAYKEALATAECLAWWMRKPKGEGIQGKRNTWVDVVKDDLEDYEALWHGEGTQERKRKTLDALKMKNAEEGWRSPIVFEDEGAAMEGLVERRSVWEQ